MAWFRIYKLSCKVCSDTSEGEGSRAMAIATAEAYGWCVTDRKRGAAVCPGCQQDMLDIADLKRRAFAHV